MFTIADSICVTVIDECNVLAGIGNELFLYFTENHRTKSLNFHLTLRDKIHEIFYKKLDENKIHIIVYAGREFASIKLDTLNNIPEILSITKLSDAVSSICMYPENGEFCLLTSHNVGSLYKIDFNTKSHLKLKSSWSEDSSTLYCSKIIGKSWEDTCFFSGTALGDIIIWLAVDGVDTNNRATVLHRLTGHKGVVFSIDVNLNSKLMTSTSDDRSVRFWDLNFEQKVDWKFCQIKKSKSLFGHTARIFRSKIIEDDNKTYIISVGEDSFMCIWTNSGDLLFKKRLHFGAVIWGLDYHKETKTVFTSSSNGNIRKICIKNILNRNYGIIKPIQLEPNLILTKVKFLKTGRLVALTNQNQLVYQDLMKKWKIVEQIGTEYKSSFLEVFDNFIVIGGYQNVTVLEYRENLDEIFINHSINDESKNMFRSCHFLNELQFLLSDDRGNLFLTNFTDFEIMEKFELPQKSKERWTTCALKYSDYILISDRCGNLFLFKKFQLKFTLKHVHGNLGITNLKFLEENEFFVYFLSTGHDGTLKTIELRKLDSNLSIIFTRNVGVNWIEKIYFLNDGMEQIIVGFNDSHFIAWEKHQDVIFQVECGGGHRYWDLLIDDEKFIFVFIRNKILNEVVFTRNYNSSNSSIDIPVNDWHIKSCNELISLTVKNINYTISGGEDNTLKICEVQNDRIKEIENLTHISNIRTVCMEKLNENEVIIFSAGGRSQLMVTKLNFHNETIKLKELLNYMLKSSDSERKKLGISQKIDFDPETRFMCLSTIKIFEENSYKILIGCSDGYLREFLVKINENDSMEIVLKNTVFYGKCILKIHSFKINDQEILITMATDGLVVFWNLNNLKLPIHKLKHHDSGINCYDFIKSDSNYYIVTGGDDQQIVLTKFSFNEFYNVCVTSTERNSNLHTAQVTGVKFLNQQFLLSTGVDQMIFKIDFLNNFFMVKSWFSCVADVKGIELLSNGQFLVYGCGVQMIC